MAEYIVNPAEATTPISVVCGNANAEIVRFVFDRNNDGVDLKDCAWAVTVKNSGGFSDTYMEGHGVSNVVVTGESISVDWSLFGIAVGTTGRTIYQLIGLQGKAIVKQFPQHTLNVQSYLESTLSSEAQEDMSTLWETIEYVGNELPGILDAEAERKVAESERSSAEAARDASEGARIEAEVERAAAETERTEAEQQRVEAFDLLELKVSKTGKVTTVTATNIDGTTTTAEVLDGKDGGGGSGGSGGGDMYQDTYDPDGDGIVDVAGRALNIPVPTASDADKVIKVQADGTYGLGEGGSKTMSADSITAGTFAGMVKANPTATADLLTPQVRNSVATSTDPGVGVQVDYPIGTEINVYEPAE